MRATFAPIETGSAEYPALGRLAKIDAEVNDPSGTYDAKITETAPIAPDLPTLASKHATVLDYSGLSKVAGEEGIEIETDRDCR